MSYVISPTVRTIGGRTECEWSEVNIDGYVVLDGYFADYASVTGGEKVDIRVGSSSDPIITITLSPGDNTAEAIRDRINSFIPNLATSPVFIDNGAIRLHHPTYLEVVDIYNRTIDFARIGLPLAVKDGYVINNYKQLDGTAANESGAGSTSIDRFDYLSLPIDINPGSNIITVWATVNNTDPDCSVGIQVGVWWSNGFEGELDDTLDTILQLPGDSITVASSTESENPFATLVSNSKQFFMFDILPVQQMFYNPITLPVPRGATKLRISTIVGNSSDFSTFKSFIVLPRATVAVYQGAQ